MYNGSRMIDWSRIDTVFLDMDGTLLDLRFDSYFWHHHLPQRFAEAQGLEFAQAQADLQGRYRAMRGTLQWYCADYWSRELGLDLVALKDEIRHRIARQPHVGEFLARINASGRPCYLVTNAHPRFVDIKLDEAQLHGYFQQVISSHAFRVPKESKEFWQALRKTLGHEPARTLMVDDDLEVLKHAEAAGIGCLVTIRQPDSAQPVRKPQGYPAIRDFSDIMPPSLKRSSA